MSNIIGSNNAATTTGSPFGPTTSTIFGTSGGLFSQTFPTAPATSTTPFITGASTAPAMNIFGQPTSVNTNPFNIPTSTAPATTSIFGSTTATNPWNVTSSIPQPQFSKYLIK